MDTVMIRILISHRMSEHNRRFHGLETYDITLYSSYRMRTWVCVPVHDSTCEWDLPLATKEDIRIRIVEIPSKDYY